MKFTIPKLKKLIEQSLTMGDVGHPEMDSYYKWYAQLTAHQNPYYKLFYLIAKEFEPNFVVELGAYRAGGAGHFAVGNPKSLVATIDMHKDMPQQADDKAACLRHSRMIPNLFYINKCTVDNLPFNNYGYECAIDDIKAYNKPIDILFIDAWHDEKYTKREWELYSPLLADEALVICDDLTNNAGQFAGMEEWWEAFPYDKFLDDRVHPGIPMGFMKYVVKDRQTGTQSAKPKAKRTARKPKRKV